jgi:hypothetical protein
MDFPEHPRNDEPQQSAARPDQEVIHGTIVYRGIRTPGLGTIELSLSAATADRPDGRAMKARGAGVTCLIGYRRV